MKKILVLTGEAGAGKSTIARELERLEGFARIRFAGPLKDMVRALGLTDREIEGDLKEQPCDKLTVGNFRHLQGRAWEAFEAIGFDLMFGFGPTDPVPGLCGLPAVFALMSFVGVLAQVVNNGGEAGATPRALMQMIGTEWGRQMIGEDLWTGLWQKRVDEYGGDLVVVEDCRFVNELAAAKAAGEAVVMRVVRPDNPNRTIGGVPGHASEANYLPHDVGVANQDGPLELGLYAKEAFFSALEAKQFKALHAL